MDGVPLIFDISAPGRRGVVLPAADVPAWDIRAALPPELIRDEAPVFPEVSELDVVRHFTALSQLNYAVDTGFYPLGSCTMKYNPKINDWVANLPGFRNVHPLQDVSTVQGLLELLHDLEQALAAITGMDAMTLEPAAGAHGELTGVLIIQAYFRHRGEPRTTILVPDTAHGTNPATASMAGYQVRSVPSNRNGTVDVSALGRMMDASVAGLMLTNPNTLGIFEPDILEIAEVVHREGGLLYYDGANANAILGKTRPGDMGFDVVHLNLHKTFATPHGGGGPGAGPVGVKAGLAPFLPVPRLIHTPVGYQWSSDYPLSIGQMRSFYGNVGVLVRAFAYILAQGAEGLETVAESAVLGANYLLHRLQPAYTRAYPGDVMHEFVLSLADQKRQGARALDVAKRLIDFGFYPPTVYFPLVVEEAMMVEPTETESRETLDRFADAMWTIQHEIEQNVAVVTGAPHHTVVGRLDEAKAARHPDLRWRPEQPA